jgi:NAD(P)-dependent dehydrogenase (short-subunit alcohol dehydrogenase family)
VGSVHPVPPPEGPLAGRVAVVTGASRGIGAATAARLAEDGAAIVLAARSVDDLEAVASAIRAAGSEALVVRTDATDLGDLAALAAATSERLGRLDILVNNAGVLPTATRSEQMDVAAWQAAFDLNLTGPWFLACRAKELMAAGGSGGVVVNVTSTASLYPSVGFSAYNASKAGLTMLTKTLALEWARDGIRVVGVAPGKVDTVLVEPIVEFSERHELRLNPLGRIGRPEEVADLIAFLVSDRAAYITGSIMTIDGGEVAATGADQGR